MKVILSLRGGGMRGVATAHLIDKIEQRSGISMRDMVDLIAGTSVGAIIGAAVSVGMSGAEIVKWFETMGEHIFEPRMMLFIRAWLWMSMYKSSNLIKALQDCFSPSMTLGEIPAPGPRLMLCSTRYEGQDAVFWKSWEHRDIPLATAVATSAAAPLYFDPIHWNGYTYCDGGVWGNNPAVYAAVQAKKMWPTDRLQLLDIAVPDQKGLMPPSTSGLASIGRIIVPLFINTGENASHEAARELVNKSFSVEPPLLDADPNIANWTSANLLRLKSCIDAGGEILVNAALDVLRYRQSTR